MWEELKTFIEVVEQQSFTKAAQKLNISQPTVSLHIRRLGSVAATFFMTTMQLCVYIKDFAPFLCEAIWLAAVAAHAILIIWFSKNFMLNLELKNVFPTFFIAYVGVDKFGVTQYFYKQHCQKDCSENTAGIFHQRRIRLQQITKCR